MNILKKMFDKPGSVSKEKETPAHVEADKRLMENLSEKQVDKIVADSFPASDPAGTY